jgi:hypothetical protein
VCISDWLDPFTAQETPFPTFSLEKLAWSPIFGTAVADPKIVEFAKFELSAPATL